MLPTYCQNIFFDNYIIDFTVSCQLLEGGAGFGCKDRGSHDVLCAVECKGWYRVANRKLRR